MAARHGKTASLSIAGTVIQGYLDNLALNRTRDTSDTTAFGLSDKTAIAGLKGATLAGAGNYDPTVSTGVMVILEAAYATDTPVAVIYYPGGNTSGQYSYTFSAILTTLNVPAAVADKVTVSFDLLVTGAVSPAVI
jgi:hypothetical protein